VHRIDARDAPEVDWRYRCVRARAAAPRSDRALYRLGPDSGRTRRTAHRPPPKSETASPRPAPDARWKRYVWRAAKDNSPGDILGASRGEAGGLAGPEIGKSKFTTAFVRRGRQAATERAVKGLVAGRFKGKRFKVELVK